MELFPTKTNHSDTLAFRKSRVIVNERVKFNACILFASVRTKSQFYWLIMCNAKEWFMKKEMRQKIELLEQKMSAQGIQARKFRHSSTARFVKIAKFKQ